MNRSIITASFLLIPFIASCALSEDELATDTEQGAPEELVADEQAEPTQSTQQNLFGADACKGTDIYVTNSRTRDGINTAIDVHYVKFYSVSEGAWKTEDLENRMLSFNEQSTWWDQALANAENDTISQWRVYYRYLSGGAWSDVVYQTMDTTNVTCVAGMNFYLTVQ
jgi:hypothetical protein